MLMYCVDSERACQKCLIELIELFFSKSAVLGMWFTADSSFHRFSATQLCGEQAYSARLTQIQHTLYTTLAESAATLLLQICEINLYICRLFKVQPYTM
jgi:hypothetical protein